MKIVSVRLLSIILLNFIFIGYYALGANQILNEDDFGLESQPGICVSARGNGVKVAATFGAVAQLSEKHGVFDHFIGSSSGSVVAFFYESILSNPAIYACYDSNELLIECSPQEVGKRVSLAIRSFINYGRHLMSDDRTGKTIDVMINSGGWLKKVVYAIGAAFDLDFLKSVRWTSLLPNWRVVSPPRSLTYAHQLKGVVSSAQLGVPDSDEAFVRQGLLNTAYLVELIGIVGDFYSGWGEVYDKQKGWVSGPGRGYNSTLDWVDYYNTCTPEGDKPVWSAYSSDSDKLAICDDKFDKMLTRFRKGFHKQKVIDYKGVSVQNKTNVKQPIYNSRKALRLSHKVGQMGLIGGVFTSTSIFSRPGLIKEFERSVGKYNRHSNRWQDFIPDHLDEDFYVGYMGRGPLVEKAVDGLASQKDFKAMRALSLGSPTWRRALRASITEPGMDGALIFDAQKDQLSFGGWVDNFAAPFLEQVGCERVFYITRSGKLSPFELGAASAVGLDGFSFKELSFSEATKMDQLFNLDNPESSQSVALNKTEASICIDWDKFDTPSPVQLGALGYSSQPMDPWACVQQPSSVKIRNQ